MTQLTFNEYQEFTATTAIYPPHKALEYCALGLAGEAGEFAGKVSKVIRDNGGKVTPEVRLELLKELGDVQWMLSELATYLDSSLESVVNMNIEKLSSRRERNVLQGSGDNR